MIRCRCFNIIKTNYKIFDAHLHTYGTFLPSKDNLISYLDKYNVKKAIITTINRAASSKVYIDDKDQTNDNGDKIKQAFEKIRKFSPKGQLNHQDVIDIAKKAPNRFYKFFWFNPKIKPEDEEENYKVLENHFNNGFCGVKIHSGINLVKIPKDIIKLVSFMQDQNKNLPLSIHSTHKTSFFSGITVRDIEKLAKDYPDLKIIILHAAMSMEYAIELGLSLKKYTNIYFETSSSVPYGILNLIRMIGHERILFGSDSPVTNPLNLEIEKILCLPISDDKKQDILYNNLNHLI